LQVEVIMKLTSIFFATFLSITAQASQRIVRCEAVDGFDNQYSFSMNVDSGEIKTMPLGGVWKTLYSEQKKCGLKVGGAVCSQTVQQNLDMPDQPHFAVVFRVSCKSIGGTVLREMNGAAEINRFGEGSGSFICGPRSSNELQLSNCSVQ